MSAAPIVVDEFITYVPLTVRSGKLVIVGLPTEQTEWEVEWQVGTRDEAIRWACECIYRKVTVDG